MTNSRGRGGHCTNPPPAPPWRASSWPGTDFGRRRPRRTVGQRCHDAAVVPRGARFGPATRRPRRARPSAGRSAT
eukprot:3242917-Lingulodinium_polyedra.AAC.1